MKRCVIPEKKAQETLQEIQESYSKQFIFFVTWEWAQLADVFVPGKPFQPSESLLDPFVSYDENEVFRIQTQERE